jgi:hypothetical protein
MSTKRIIGVFNDESLLLPAMKKLKANNIKIKDLHGPCVDHDVLRTLTRESRFSYLSLLIGIFTVISVFAGVYYTSVISYPLVYGGKPIFSFPPLVVVLFLVTILVTGVTSTVIFLGLERLFPGKSHKVPSADALDDKYYLVTDQGKNPEQVREWFLESGAMEIIEDETK